MGGKEGRLWREGSPELFFFFFFFRMNASLSKGEKLR